MVALSCSLALLLAAVLLHHLQPDAFAWFTIWPVWLWLVPGGLLLLPGLVARWRPGWTALGIWLATLLAMADETPGLLRRGPVPVGELRIVTLNCAGGQPQPAEALVAWHPDLVLLQEAPSARDCWTLAGKLYGWSGKAHWALETAVLSRYPLTPVAEDRLTWSQVRAATPQGPVDVVSLRLMPVPLGFNLWSSDCRAGLVANRRLHREQLAEVLTACAAVPETSPLVVGGDFNAPAGDAIFRLFPTGFGDAWTQAGRGWGNTCVADLPSSRIDQLWYRGPLRPVAVRAVMVPGSDHRAVIADFAWD